MDRRALDWARSALGPDLEVLVTSPLTGGTTGSVMAIEAGDGRRRRHRFVLKLYRPDPSEPDSAWREAHILEQLAPTDLPVPRIVAMDRDGAHAGCPALLMTRLGGRILKRPRGLSSWLEAMACLALRIHRLPIPQASLPRYEVWGLDEPLEVPWWWRSPEVWRAAVEIFRGPIPDEPPCFIHRDLHAANVLWSGSSLSGVVDWLHGCWGPASADLAHCRLNLWLDTSPAAAQVFLDGYRRLDRDMGPYNHFWDIADALSWHVDPRRDGWRFARRWELFIATAVSLA
ncbi:MAG TPA: aminoglycoside phosphotransferase family protein [Candidatus Dormibacteraeota bacterium]|nr:aminoglycoside phosphotransferase family protein [Candidatus Dormibacteraeota bacterium]